MKIGPKPVSPDIYCPYAEKNSAFDSAIFASALRRSVQGKVTISWLLKHHTEWIIFILRLAQNEYKNYWNNCFPLFGQDPDGVFAVSEMKMTNQKLRFWKFFAFTSNSKKFLKIEILIRSNQIYGEFLIVFDWDLPGWCRLRIRK